MQEFWYYYVKPKYCEKEKQCNMHTDSFIVFGGKIKKKIVGLGIKTCSYLIDNGSEDKKAKGTKSVS